MQKVTNLATQTDIISNATYNPMGQLTALTEGSYGGIREARTYNSLGQLTQLNSCTPSFDYYCTSGTSIVYNYSATQNNGKITSEQDLKSGEQVTYTYDSLNRLASATGSGWGQSYAYDGFGNLTNQTVTSGTAPSLSVSYDPATNRQTGECADANGNINSLANCTNGNYFDMSNRLARNGGSSLLWAYSYAPGNKRVWRGVWSSGTQTVDEITFWGANGLKLETHQVSQTAHTFYTLPQLVATATDTKQYFGGRQINYLTDRLGSVGKYFPYGQERPSATQDGTDKFATYFRDSETGLDYAKNRYHQPGMGRFMTVDPYKNSAGPGDPGSWNRYSYTGGDPVNLIDPSGRLACVPGPDCRGDYDDDESYCDVYASYDPMACDPFYRLLAGLPCLACQKNDGGGSPTDRRNEKDTSPGLGEAVTDIIVNQKGCNDYITGRFGTQPGHGSIADMMTHINDVTIYDVATIPSLGGKKLGDVLPEADSGEQSLKDFVGNDYASVVTVHGKITTNVVIGSQFYGYSGAGKIYYQRSWNQKEVTLAHEMLHVYTGLDDDQLAGSEGLGLSIGGMSSSVAITRFLESGCTLFR